MSQQFTIFFLGATGYIGGPLLKRHLVVYSKACFVALVRDEKAVAVVRAAGVHDIVQGSLSDVDKFLKASSEADVVINLANADDVDLTAAVLAGAKERFFVTGKRPVFIHSSGSAVSADQAQGVFDPFTAAVAFDDENEDNIKRIPSNALNRNVSAYSSARQGSHASPTRIFAADTEDYVDGWILCPPTVYCRRENGFSQRDSIQIPLIMSMALKVSQAVHVNDGSATWDNVHVEDLVDLYQLFLANALSPENRSTKSSPYSKFYFVSSGKHTWKQLTAAIAQAMYKRGVLPTPETKAVSMDESSALHPWAFAVSTNSFVVPSKAKTLGWKPKHLNWKADLDADVENALKTMRKI